MKYKYQAKSKEGELQVGFVEAPSKDMAANILVSHDLFVLSLDSADKKNIFDRFSSYFAKVRRKDMVVFTRQLATLLEARLPLNTALKTLYEQTSHPSLKEAAYQINEDVDAGLAFSQALEKQQEIFSDFFVSMVRTAEVTGNLNEIMGFLADYIEKETILVTKARSAMIYPGIVVGLFVVVAGILVTFVFPQLAPIFEESKVELPFLTRTLIHSGQFVTHWWPALIVAFIVLFLILLDYLKNPEGRAFSDEMKIRLPIIKKIYSPVIITRFANAGSMLLKGGVPLAQSVEIIGQTIDNVVYEDILREVADEVRQGVPLSEALSRYPLYFPPLVSQMLAVGETTGQLDKMFFRISAFYDRESDTVINNIVDLIQPILMIAIGVMVALLFASVLLPLYQLTSSVGS
ncbi:MAG: type II secretion system F family protein [Candidatus Liptonbacteria bacterium]|nr:type II secretion system F family protein [Candidatus Liptonbacteria bacterium]